MGRIITFKAPAYYATSRSNSEDETSDSEIIVPVPKTPDSGDSFKRRSISLKSKSVSFSEDPPRICFVEDWDRSPAIPDPEDVGVSSNESESDEEGEEEEERDPAAVQCRRASAGSLEQVTRWARRLSI